MELYIGHILNLPDDYVRTKDLSKVEPLLVEIVDETRSLIKQSLIDCFNALYDDEDDDDFEPPTKKELLLMIQEL